MYPNLTHAKGPTVMTSATNTDEAAAVAAMFKAQTDVWEETQEKMSQSVHPFRDFVFLCSS